jgi:tRNA nucleotidyltransferase (CCA-adding enzyme)
MPEAVGAFIFSALLTIFAGVTGVFEVLRACGALAVIFPELDALFGIPNVNTGSVAIDTGIRMLQRLSRAVVCFDDPVMRFASLLLELGKIKTPLADWPLHAGYETRSVPLIKALCERLRLPHEYRELAELSARFHLELQRGISLGSTHIVQMLEQMDAFRRPERFEAVLSVSDVDCPNDNHRMTWLRLLEVCSHVETSDLVKQHRGEAIKHALRARREACVEWQLKRWANNEE